MPTKTKKKATRVAQTVTNYPFTLAKSDLTLLTEGQRQLAIEFKNTHSIETARKYVESCVKTRKGLCIYCGSKDIVKATPNIIKDRVREFQFRCKNCKQFF